MLRYRNDCRARVERAESRGLSCHPHALESMRDGTAAASHVQSLLLVVRLLLAKTSKRAFIVGKMQASGDIGKAQVAPPTVMAFAYRDARNRQAGLSPMQAWMGVAAEPITACAKRKHAYLLGESPDKRGHERSEKGLALYA